MFPKMTVRSCDQESRLDINHLLASGLPGVALGRTLMSAGKGYYGRQPKYDAECEWQLMRHSPAIRTQFGNVN